MRDVVHKPRQWTLACFLEGLFDYCFPTNFRQVQQEKFGRFTQCGHPIQNFWCDLEELANSVGKISSRDLVIQFWQGADQYL